MSTEDLQLLGPFRFHRNARLLTLRGIPVRLPFGAVEFLAELLATPGAAVAVEHLEQRLRHFYPKTTFDLLDLAEALNLELGKSTPDHFVAQVNESAFCLRAPSSGATSFESERRTGRASLPPLPGGLVHRPLLLDRCAQRLKQSRLVTLVGPGGVGKTTAALVLASDCQAGFPDGTWFVDLAPIRQAGVLGHAVLMALNTEGAQTDPGLDALARALSDALWDKQALVVLDNCEHLIDEAAAIAEIMLRSQGVRVLATSREPLKTFGETVVRVGPMDVPPPGTSPDMPTALRFDAVELFLARAPRIVGNEEKLASELNLVFDVCRRLDGIPLALELAAARVQMLGLPGLKEHLARWPVEPLGAEVAASRHRTLEAALHWSHDLLSDVEKVALRRLSVFRGDFPFESALDVISLGSEDKLSATSALLGLQSKSLLQANAFDSVHYRLLETTRDYAHERLHAAAEDHLTRHYHSLDCSRRLGLAEQEWSKMNGKDWIARYGRLIDDVRHAIRWGLDSNDEIEVTADLVIQALPLAGRLALFDEAHGWLERALAAVCKVDRKSCRKYELRLLVSFRGMAAHTKRDFAQLPGSDERILALVDLAGDDRDAAGACMSVWFSAMNRAHYASASTASEQFISVAQRTGSVVDQVEAYKVASYAFHFLGDHRRAHAYAMKVLDLAPNNVAANYYLVVGCDARVSVRIVEARTLWILGRFEDAREVGKAAFQMALEDRALAVCLVLSYVVIPMALWNGDFEQALENVARLKDWSTRHDLKPHQDWAKWYDFIASHRCEPSPSTVPSELEQPDPMQADMFVTLGCHWLIDQVTDRVAAGQVGWATPEVYRRQGEALLLAGKTAAARAKFREAIAAAQSSQAKGWELRAATSLAALEAREGDMQLAKNVMNQLRGQVDLAFRTADTDKACRLLEELATS